MRRIQACLALLLVAGAAPGAPIDDIRFEAWGRRELSYLERPSYYLGRAELLALPVPPPPPNSATSTRRELDELLRLQADRTRAEERSIRAHRDYASVCSALIAAADRDWRRAPKTRALLQHVEADASLAVFHAKRRFNRARPHQLETRLLPSIAVPAHPAYPSGHALQGHLVSRVLASIAPDHREALTALGERIGREREIAGLHYPSDSAASRALGDALLSLLEKNPKFVRELEAARAEWRSEGL